MCSLPAFHRALRWCLLLLSSRPIILSLTCFSLDYTFLTCLLNFRLLSFSTLYCLYLVCSLVFSSLSLTCWSPKGERFSFFRSFSSFFHAVVYVMSKWLLPFLFLWTSSNNLHFRTYMHPSCVSSRTSVVASVAFISLYHPFPHLFLALLHFSYLPDSFLLLSFSTLYCLYLVCSSVFSSLSLTWWSPKGEMSSFFCSFSSFFHAVASVMSIWLFVVWHLYTCIYWSISQKNT